MWKTPGLWNDIPHAAKVRAAAKGNTIEGTQVRMINAREGKRLIIKVYGLGDVELDSRDQWEVVYEVQGFDEVMKAAPIGTVWREGDDYYPRFVKVSDTHCTKQSFRNNTPEVYPILQFGGDASYFAEVPRNLLAESAGS